MVQIDDIKTNVQTMLAEGCDWDGAQWASWIADQVQAREDICRRDPDELIAAYNRERGYTRDYHGRELFELIQNADDAGVRHGKPVEAVVVLTQDGLCMGNTGVPFSAPGVKSLLISNDSPKQEHSYIGNRGLGFRSILSWTQEPMVLSGNLSIAFNQERARAWLARICGEDGRVKARVARFQAERGNRWPVPLLAVPEMIGKGEIAPGQSSGTGPAAVLELARRLRSEGCDTVIGIPFSVQTDFEEALTQLENIGRETLLFLRNLSRLTVKTPDKVVEWRVNRCDDIVQVFLNGADEQVWQLFSASGEIPESCLRAEQAEQEERPKYEIKLAVPTDRVKLPGFLFNFFPTHVSFPYPVVAHATMELTENRENIVDSPVNRFLVGELAKTLAHAAEMSTDSTESWRGFSFIAATGDLDPRLRELGFRDALLAAAKTRKIVPVYGGGWVQAANARRLDTSQVFEDWLPRDGFEDLVLTPKTRHISETLELMGLTALSEEQLQARLNGISPFLTIEQRADLIVGLQKAGLISTKYTPDLLADPRGDVIPARYMAFLPPTDGKSFPLPDWLEIRMLDAELATLLPEKLGPMPIRELVRQLPAFRLREYGLTGLAIALNAGANERVNKEPDREAYYRALTLQAMYELYLQAGEDSKSDRPADLKVRLLTATGKFAPADTLYFGKDYPTGLLTGGLYSGACPELILAKPEMQGLYGDIESVSRFLSWLGVASQPRSDDKVTIRLYSNVQEYLQFLEYVKMELDYPARFNYGSSDFRADSPDDLYGAYLTGVSTIDRLEKIVRTANPEVVLSWVATDSRLEEWRSRGDTGAKLEIVPYGMRSPRELTEQSLPSYVTWLLEHTAWLPTSNGHKQAPNRCIASVRVSDEVRSILPQPAIHQGHEIFGQLRIDATKLRSALYSVGVKPALDDLTWDEFYKLLLDLPRLDPAGKSARSLHRQLIMRPDNGEGPSGVMYDEFRKKGKLWGQAHGEFAYFPVDDLLYNDAQVLPEVLRREIPLLELDRRRGAQKVKEWFCVKPLDARDLAVHIDEFEPHVRTSDLSSELERLKRFVYAWRLYSGADATGLPRLKTLKVQLCTRASGSARIGTAPMPIQLQLPGDVIIDDTNTAYLVSEPNIHPQVLSDELMADTVGEILAGIFRLENGGDFARLASCTPGRRVNLLARMLGIEVEEARHWVSQAEAKLDLQQDTNDEAPHSRFWTEPPQKAGPQQQPQAEQDSLGQPQPETEPASNQEPKSATPGSGVMTAAKQEQIPLPPARVVAIRVSGTPSFTMQRSKASRVLDASECEKVVKQFEALDNQGRFSEETAHLQGRDAWGCDIVSFASAEDAALFKETHDDSLVERFIEVKGSTSEHGIIALKGNELEAARRWRDRYYLYRVYKSGPGEYELGFLGDPLNVENQNVVIEVDLFRDTKTDYWQLSIQPETTE